MTTEELLRAFQPVEPSTRYQDVEDLGSGGMGEVRGVVDEQLDRVVAMKILKEDHTQNPELLTRLLREAKVQGQLEHPAIVPVYDIGMIEERPFFTMKRIRGSTLKQILNRQRAGDPDLMLRFSRRRLLGAFSTVCLAVDFAHERGVVHRDLKPANFMLGDFGEVYVLDWGVAKYLDDEDDLPQPDYRFADVSSSQNLDELTSTGELFGTPGYVAPEQLQGEGIDKRTDVFALGTILFELLTHEKLYPGDTAMARIDATLAGTDVGARAAALDVPPELAQICAKAVASDPEDRYSSARELHEELERFLGGDRDLQLRNELAREHAVSAQDWADRAIRDESGGFENRKRAMQEVSRALALDPQNETAIGTFVRLLTEPPKKLPSAIRDRLEREANQSATNVLTGALRAHTAVLFVFTPLIFALGVQSWGLFALLVSLNIATVVVDYVANRHLPTRRGTDLVFVASVSWTCALSLMFGPYILVPAVAVANTTAYLLVRRSRGAVWAAAIGCVPVVIPLLGQLAGVLPTSYAFGEAGMRLLPAMHNFPELPTHLFLTGGSIGVVLATAFIVDRFRRALTAAEHRLQLQAWQFRQLLPTDVG